MLQMSLITDSNEEIILNRMAGIVGGLVVSHLSDYTDHDRPLIECGVWRRAIWFVRPCGTDMIVVRPNDGSIADVYAHRAERIFDIDLDAGTMTAITREQARALESRLPDVGWLKWATYENDDRKRPMIAHVLNEASMTYETGHLYIERFVVNDRQNPDSFWYTGKLRVVGCHTGYCRHDAAHHHFNLEIDYRDIVGYGAMADSRFAHTRDSDAVVRLEVNRPVATYAV